MNTLHQDDVPALFTLMKDTRDKRMYQRYQAVYLTCKIIPPRK